MSVKKPSNWPAKIDWIKIPEEQKELYANLYGKIDTLERRSAERGLGSGTGTEENVILNIQDSIENFDQDILNQIEKSLENMSRSGAFFAREGRFTRGLQEASKEMSLLFSSSDRAAKAFEFLSTNLKGFDQLGNEFTGGSKALTGALALQQAAFEKAGLSASTFKDNVDMMIYSFGANAQEVQSFNFQINNLAEDLKMMPEEVSRNFQLVAKNLSYDIGAVSDQFARMQKLSIQTGVDVGTISGQFGTGMDTISGASGAAANINALLGRNAFSATELLMMDEATRAESVREAIMNDPRLKASLAKGGAEGKFALDTVKDILGMSRQDARRFITTGKLEDADKPPSPTDKDASLKSKIIDKVDTKQMQGAIKDFSITIENVDKEFSTLVEDIKEAQLSPTERDRLEYRRQRLSAERPDQETLMTRMRGQRRVADLPSTLAPDYNEAAQFTLKQIAPYSRILPELEQQRALGVVNQKDFQENIKLLQKAKTAAEQNAAADKVRRFMRGKIDAAQMVGRLMEGRAGLDKVTISQMQSMTQIPGVGNREIRQVTRYFREKSATDVNAAKTYVKNIGETSDAFRKAEKELKEADKKDRDAAQKKLDTARKRLLNAIDDKPLNAKRDEATVTTQATTEAAADMMEAAEKRRKQQTGTPAAAGITVPTIADPSVGKTFNLDPNAPVDFTLPIQKSNKDTAALSEKQRKKLLTTLENSPGAPFRFGAEDKRGGTTPAADEKIFNQTITLAGGGVLAKLQQVLKDGVLTMKDFKFVFDLK